MKIAVCIKQVPNTTEIKIDPKTNTLVREGVESIINPDDKSALEVALTVKQQTGAQVNVVCMGPSQAEIALREALAMGADNAYLVSDRAFAGSDTLATSTILAYALKRIGFDYIIAGRQAIDGDTAQVGPQIAEHLDVAAVTYCADFSYDQKADRFTIKRQIEDRYQILSVGSPALFTVLGANVKPRYMNAKDIIAQDQKEIVVLTQQELQCPVSDIGLTGSPTKVKATFTKQYDGNKQLVELPAEQAAKLIAEQLKQKHIV